MSPSHPHESSLALIEVVVLGLAYLARHRRRSGVRSERRPGRRPDPRAVLFDRGRLRRRCGTLVVPENRADPDSRLTALP